MSTLTPLRWVAPVLLLTTAACVDDAPTVPIPEAASLPSISPAYTLIDLGTLRGWESYARSINSSMQVVGVSHTASGTEHAFLWTPSGGMADLGTMGGLPGERSAALDINDAGVIVGYSGDHPVLRTAAGEWVDLLPPGATGGVAYGINQQGDVVGYTYSGSRFQALLYRPGMGRVELDPRAYLATDINDSLQIIGRYHGWRDSAFVMQYPGGPLRAIGGSSTDPEAINNHGVVVGTTGRLRHARAFVWDAVRGYRILPRQFGSDGGSRAYDIDEAGRIAGSVQYSPTSPMYAALWTPDGSGGYVLNILAAKQAEAMDESGNLVGFAGFPSNPNHAALWSTSPEVPPAPPSALAAEIVSASALWIYWTDASNNETRFEVWRSRRGPDGEYPADQMLAQVRVNSVAFLDTAAAPGESYRYRVQACSATYCTSSAHLFVAVPLPAGAVVGLQAFPAAANRMDLAWTGGPHATEFRVRRSVRGPDGTFPPDEMLGVAPAAAAYADSTVQPGGVYRYRVLACNVLGCAGSAAVIAGVPLVPAAPAGLAATIAGPRRIDLAWTDASMNEREFRVRRSTRAGDGSYPPYETLASLRAGTTGFSDTTAVPGGVYRYQVQACNVSGCGSGPPVVATVPLPPEPPTGVTARRAGGGVEVRWTDASTTETLFRVRRSLRRADGTFGGYAPLADLPAGSVQYQDNSAAAGGTYRYRVEACRTVACAGATSGPVTMP